MRFPNLMIWEYFLSHYSLWMSVEKALRYVNLLLSQFPHNEVALKSQRTVVSSYKSILSRLLPYPSKRLEKSTARSHQVYHYHPSLLLLLARLPRHRMSRFLALLHEILLAQVHFVHVIHSEDVMQCIPVLILVQYVSRSPHLLHRTVLEIDLEHLDKGKKSFFKTHCLKNGRNGKGFWKLGPSNCLKGHYHGKKKTWYLI